MYAKDAPIHLTGDKVNSTLSIYAEAENFVKVVSILNVTGFTNENTPKTSCNLITV